MFHVYAICNQFFLANQILHNNQNCSCKLFMDFPNFCTDPNEGPSVEAALSMSPTTAAAQAEPRKAIIGTKKPAGRKGVRGEQFVKKEISFARL